MLERTLPELKQECQTQIKAYAGNPTQESVSCAEIVRRAAQGDQVALGVLLELASPLIRQKCPRSLWTLEEDIVQEVCLRLVRKFGSRTQPYLPTTFAAFRLYLNLTLRSVIVNLQQRDQELASLDHLQERGDELAASVSPIVETEQRLLLRSLLELLPDPLEREALHRRYILQETPEEIVEALRVLAPAMAKEQIYRLVERGLRRLVNHPQVKQMQM
jgi:RNA polymerase sigma factor (sigma-70 family)